MMVMHHDKVKLEDVIGLIYLLPSTRRSPSVTLKLSPNAKFRGLFPVGIGGKGYRLLHSEHCLLILQTENKVITFSGG